MPMIHKGLTQVQTVWKAFLNAGGYDAHVVPKLKIISASKHGNVECQFQIESTHLNRLKSIHGGFLSTLVDIGGSLALAAKGMYSTGVSTDLNVSFVNSAIQGETIIMKARCDKWGGNLAYTSVELFRKDASDGELITVALGRHTKYIRLAHISDKKMVSESNEEKQSPDA